MPKLLINPYKVGPPVEGVNFYGRSELLDKVYQTLQQSNVVLLQGQRRIGKTSFLKQLTTYMERRKTTQKLLQFVPVLFDIQRYVQVSLPQFQMHLAEAIARPLPLVAPLLSELEADLTLFRDIWLPQAYEVLGDRALVILVDEFDNLDGLATSQTMQTLIPFLGQLVSGESHLKWVLAFGRLAGKLPIQYEPIVSSGVQLRLSFLSPQITRELLEKPVEGVLTYMSEAIERIYQLTSGQPHLTQALGSEIFQSVVLEKEQNLVTVEDVDAAIPPILEAYGNAIASIVRVPPVEERVLVTVACLTESAEVAKKPAITQLLIENNVQFNRDELTSAIESLINWELLSGDNQSVKVSVELLRVWIVKNLTVEPRQEQATAILFELAEKSFDVAERLFHSGRYDLAIGQYLVVLDYIPNHHEALRRLAKAYQLRGESIDRIRVLKRLIFLEPNATDELVEALLDCIEESIAEQDFSTAIEQYKTLIELRDSIQFQKSLFQVCAKELDKQVEILKKMTYPYPESKDLSEKLSNSISNTITCLNSFFDSLAEEELQRIIIQIALLNYEIAENASTKMRDDWRKDLNFYSRFSSDNRFKQIADGFISSIFRSELTNRMIAHFFGAILSIISLFFNFLFYDIKFSNPNSLGHIVYVIAYVLDIGLTVVLLISFPLFGWYALLLIVSPILSFQIKSGFLKEELEKRFS